MYEAISPAMNSTHSSSTRSIFVMATTRRFTPNTRRTARCSTVWGMMPSSAATTSRATSTPVAPATIWRTKRSWPGTSTTPIVRPLGSLSWAKPSWMVMPRRFSSSRRSGSVPVRARTSEDLPWSIWPAVPSTSEALVLGLVMATSIPCGPAGARSRRAPRPLRRPRTLP